MNFMSESLRLQLECFMDEFGDEVKDLEWLPDGLEVEKVNVSFKTGPIHVVSFWDQREPKVRQRCLDRFDDVVSFGNRLKDCMAALRQCEHCGQFRPINSDGYADDDNVYTCGDCLSKWEMTNPEKSTTSEVDTLGDDDAGEEVHRKRLLDEFRSQVEHWAKESARGLDVKAKLSGLAFSMLATLDGATPGIPPYCLHPLTDDGPAKFDIGGDLHGRWYE